MNVIELGLNERAEQETWRLLGRPSPKMDGTPRWGRGWRIWPKGSA